MILSSFLLLYYLLLNVGTGFRTKQNVGNKVGGSCNKTQNLPGFHQYRMRLKLYVCTDDEIQKGECNVCRTSECYSKGVLFGSFYYNVFFQSSFMFYMFFLCGL